MNNLINKVLNWFKSHPMILTVLAAIAVLWLVLMLFFYGVTLKNHLSNWWYDRGTTQAHKEIDKVMAEAAAAKQIAAEALEALEQEKQITAQERKKRELAEQLLNDKSKTANEKLKAYEAAINKSPTITPVSTDVDALCARARAAGIDCQ